MKKSMLFGLGLLLLSSVACAAELASDVVKIVTPEIVVPVAEQGQTKIVMDLENKGSETHKVVAAFSTVAKEVQLHEMVTEKGSMVMRQVKDFELQPKHDTLLKKNGLHVMLMGIDKKLTPNESIPLTLIFDDGSHITVTTKVVNS